MDITRQLVDKEIYAWTTKRWSSKQGLRELIGTPDEPVLLTRDQAHRIWNTSCRVIAVELSMDLGKIYIAFESDTVLIANTHLLMRFGVWIKVPADKNKYLKSLRMNSLLGKRKRGQKIRSGISNKANATEAQKNNASRSSALDNNAGRSSALDNNAGRSSALDNNNESEDSFSETSEEEIHGTLPVEHNLLQSRTLQSLYNLSQMDPYIQLGDLVFERHKQLHGFGHSQPHQQSSLLRHAHS
jgi:hypothetical protein